MRTVHVAASGGTDRPPIGWTPIMERIPAYLISFSIIGFGLWICAEAPAASVLAGVVIGLFPIAVGLASLANEFHNDLYS
jgi:hypothetical protein